MDMVKATHWVVRGNLDFTKRINLQGRRYSLGGVQLLYRCWAVARGILVSAQSGGTSMHMVYIYFTDVSGHQARSLSLPLYDFL